MAYLERLLAPGEQIVRRTRRHPIVLLRAIGGALFVVAAGLFLAAYLSRSGRLPEEVRLGAWGGAALAIVGLLFVVPAWLRWRAEQYVVTDRRVIQLEGVLSKRVLDSSLAKINDVRLSQPLLGRLLGYGTIEILTASEGGINRLDHLPAPLDFKHAMMAPLAANGAPAPPAAGTAARLAELEGLRREGLVSDEEYRAKRATLLDKL